LVVSTVRLRDTTKSWIDAYASHDNGQTWSFLSMPEPDTGEGNPPSLLRLGDGRLCLSYGRRAVPYGILARLSGDQGKNWGQPIVLRDDGAAADVGYVRSIIRPDGKVVAVYYYNDRSSPERYLAATIWDPGKP
jgi:Neuraminidase (sialidase)